MITDVVAALIWDDNRFLACRRPAHKARGLLWEFVGGKVEPGEELQDALIRECYEELAVKVRVGEIFMSLIHEYPDITVRLTLFNATICEGEIQRLEHNDIRWITTTEIDNYDFCPADEEILRRLKTVENGIQAELISMADEDYKRFHTSLMPTVDPGKVIGVRVPKLRTYAKQIKKYGLDLPFCNRLPHRYYEEDNLHGILISGITDYNEAVCALDCFLPYVDNWATCDLIAPKAFNQRPASLIDKVRQWIESGHTYTVRYGIGVLMRYYLDDAFSSEYLQMVSAIRSDAYYVNMMIAWYFATALAKQYPSAIKIIEHRVLPQWVHNKTIQKAIESYRITPQQKEYLRSLKIVRNEDYHEKN